MIGRDLIVILGIDTVRPKTLYQTRWLAEHGVRTLILTYHRDPGSLFSDESAEIEQIRGSARARARQVWATLVERRREIHHVELYPGGRFSFVFALMARLLRLRVLTVERGDLLQCQQRAYPLATRLSVYACYQLSHAVWYREPYMARPLRRWRVRRPFMLPNAVPVPPDVPEGERPLDLLWVNRLIPERHPDWFAHAVTTLAAERPVRCAVVGFSSLDDPTPLERAVLETLVSLPDVECLGFAEPEPFFTAARFFVLPADVVFANFALLESMARGVVPVVFDAEGTDRIVTHMENGLVVEPDPSGLARALGDALALDESEWRRLSAAARRTIEEGFSVDAWGARLLDEYRSLAG